jgi:hypothetical protein
MQTEYGFGNTTVKSIVEVRVKSFAPRDWGAEEEARL